MVQRMNLLGEPGVGLPRGPGRPVPSRADVQRARGQAWGVLIVLALLVIGLLVSPSRNPSGDVFTGARGSFPAAFAAGAPIAPERVVRRTADERALAHGLSLRWTAFGVTALNLRTGRSTGAMSAGSRRTS